MVFFISYLNKLFVYLVTISIKKDVYLHIKNKAEIIEIQFVFITQFL